MNNFFIEKLGYAPYKYQLKVAELLLEGKKNVVLYIPTGAGKTWASIIPFLYAQEKRLTSFPSKMIYSLPLRTLVNSIYQDVKDICSPSIHTGEYSEDPYFEKDIIFSTIDQTLSNFLCFPLSLSQRQANINAGSIIGSYLVFDEFHLLDENLSMATTLGMLKMLGGLCRCCIMTATLSEGFTDLLKDNLLNYEIVTLDDFPEDKVKIGSLKPEKNKKKIYLLEEPLSALKILENHQNKTIVICNRVETAQKTYNELVKALNNLPDKKLINTEIICLHSRFFDKDRKDKENKLKNLFGKYANNQSAILIATQVIEAGMDITCDVMHTEISPISSFLQRAGRCARFSEQEGKIFIYQILTVIEKDLIELTLDITDKEDKKEIQQLKNKYLPYQETECKIAYLELKKHKTLDGDIPKKLIQEILKETKEELYQKFTNGDFFNYNKIIESWRTCEKSNYRNTVRDIQSVEITLINDNMCEVLSKHPYKFQSLGMYKWSLVGWLNKIVKGEGPVIYEDEDWLVKERKEAEDIFLENDEDSKFELVSVKSIDFKKLPSQVYVNSKFLGYESAFGFNWQYEETFNNVSPEKVHKNREDVIKPLTKDTFYQHNMGLMGVFEKEFLGVAKDKLDFVFTELTNYIVAPELQKKDFIKLTKLMIVLHDYGKLNTDWQEKMQKYQALKEEIDLKNYNEILAHTDYNCKDEKDRALASKTLLHKRPVHAGVGALAAQVILPELYNNDYLKGGISTAIARHHSPLSTSYPDFEISDTNYKAMQELLKKFDFDIELEKQDYKGQLESFEFDGYEEHLVYFFFVRILRLCDQKATEDLHKYFNEK